MHDENCEFDEAKIIMRKIDLLYFLSITVENKWLEFKITMAFPHITAIDPKKPIFLIFIASAFFK